MCPGREMGCGGGRKAVRVRPASQSKRGELATSTNQAPALVTWCNSRVIRSLWVAPSIRVSSVCASHRVDRWLPWRKMFFGILRRHFQLQETRHQQGTRQNKVESRRRPRWKTQETRKTKQEASKSNTTARKQHRMRWRSMAAMSMLKA